MTLSSPLPLLHPYNNEQPAVVFMHVYCQTCHTLWAICLDAGNPNSGNLWYFDAKFTPSMPNYSVTVSDKIICPRCIQLTTLRSTHAVLTSDGGWLYLDKSKGSDGIVATAGVWGPEE